MKILVTGASGYIGHRTIEMLLQQNWVTSIVGTDVKEAKLQHPKYTFYQKDIRENLDDLLEKEAIETIVHAAYVLTPIHDKALMEDINKNGTRNILKASVKAKVKQVVYLSSTTCYGFHADNEEPLTEDHSPLRGNDDFTYAKNKKEIEGIIKDFKKENPELSITILRPCFVVGPGFKNPMAQHFQKKMVLLPSVKKPWQYVHEDDLVNIIILMIKEKKAGVYNVAGDGSMTFKEMISALGNIILPVPWALIFPLNNLAWHLRLSFITKFPSSAMRMMIHAWIASNEKLKRETGYQYMYDTKSAFLDFVGSVK